MVGRKPGETERGIESIDLEARCNICWEHEIYQDGKHWQGPRCCLVPWGLEQGRLPLESLQHCFGQMGRGYHAQVRKYVMESLWLKVQSTTKWEWENGSDPNKNKKYFSQAWMRKRGKEMLWSYSRHQSGCVKQMGFEWPCIKSNHMLAYLA